MSYCRTVTAPAGDRAACTHFDAARGQWGGDRVARTAERTQAETRTWQETDSGPALCGRTGDLAHQRLSCSVLTQLGWRVPARNAAWGNVGTYVTSDEGKLSYCRSLAPPAGPARLVCTALEASGRVWGRNRVSGPARLTIADPF